MDRRERWADLQESLRLAIAHHQAKVWTSVPGIVQSFDPDMCTAVVQPAVGGIRQDAGGAPVSVALPVLHDVPVVFPRGGGCLLTFPVSQGDECLLVFSARPVDAWWQSGGVQRPANARMHDLSDGFAILGPMSRANVPSSISTTAAELRTDDGGTVIRLQPGAVVIQAAEIHLQGNVQISGGSLTHNGTSVGATHTHGGVASGGSNTGTPT